MKIVALAGGVGGAKLAHGLALTLPPENLTIVVNTGDDFVHLGLQICPDLDTVCYTLAGLDNPETGWGRRDETWAAMRNIARLGGPTWFNLGDQDLGTHLERTRRLQAGQPLSAITRAFCAAWGVGPVVLPMSDDPVRTLVETVDEGILAFQEYFVRRRCEPVVRGFVFQGADAARPAPGVVEALEAADAVIFCPSNPWVSIGPILAVKPLQAIIAAKPVWAVSPIVGGQAIKGPAAKMYRELGIEPSALAVARQYQNLLTGLVMDEVDREQAEAVRATGVRPYVTNTIMRSVEDRKALAEEVLRCCQ